MNKCPWKIWDPCWREGGGLGPSRQEGRGSFELTFEWRRGERSRKGKRRNGQALVEVVVKLQFPLK